MTKPREPERQDLYVAKDAAARPCACPANVTATKSELTLAQFKRVVCDSCQAEACLEWLTEIADKG